MAGRRAALLVAVDSYENTGLRRLAAPADDVRALGAVLGDPQLCDFEVEVVQNARSYEITQRVERFFAEARPADLLVLHFSCHGLKDDGGELYLAAVNTVPDLLGSTAVEAAVVNRFMRRSRARQVVLFLDCCYGGAFERGLMPRAGGDVNAPAAFAPPTPEPGRGRAVITASSAMEYAFEGADLTDGGRAHPSVFTGALVQGLSSGEADRDQDGVVSLGELYDFVYEKVRDVAPAQTPSKWEFGLEGGLVLARNPAPAVVPAALPDELAAAVASSVPWVRAAAVDQLVRVASGDDLPVAASARAALVSLRDDDSRQVNVAVAEALAATGLRVRPRELDLGDLPVGPEPREIELRLIGVPLARAVHATATGPGLTARRRDDVVRVRVDTAAPGPVHGDVVLAGVGEETRVRVRCRVVPAGEPPARVPPEPEPAPAPEPEPEPVVQPRPQPGGSRRRWLVAGAAAAVAVLAAVLVSLLSPGGSDGPSTGGTRASTSPTPSPSATGPGVLGLPKVLAHRGGEEKSPAQTAAAFTAAARAGYGVETDVRWTRDGVAVLVHDDDAQEDLQCPARLKVSEVSFTTLDADCRAKDQNDQATKLRVATMKQAAAAVRDNAGSQFFPEIKVDQTAGQARAFLKVLTDAGIVERTVITSFQPSYLADIRTAAAQADLDVRLMLFQQKGKHETPVTTIESLHLFAVALDPPLATDSSVARLHGLGLRVIAWSAHDELNTPAGWRAAKQAGADTVLTDKPAAYLAWLKTS